MVSPAELGELVCEAGLLGRAVVLCVMERQHAGMPATFVQPALASRTLQAFCGRALASKGVRDDTVAMARVLPSSLRGAFIAIPQPVWKAQVELTPNVRIERGWCHVPMVLLCRPGSGPGWAVPTTLVAGAGAWLGKTPLSKEEKECLYYSMRQRREGREVEKDFLQLLGIGESACAGHPAYQRLRRDLGLEMAAFQQRPDVRRARCLEYCGVSTPEFGELLRQHYLDFVKQHGSEFDELREYINEEDRKETRQEVVQRLATERAKAETYVEECWQIAARPCSKCGRPQPPSGYQCECQRPVTSEEMGSHTASGRDEAAGEADGAKADAIRGCKFQTRRRGKNLQANLPSMRG